MVFYADSCPRWVIIHLAEFVNDEAGFTAFLLAKGATTIKVKLAKLVSCILNPGAFEQVVNL